MIIQIITEREIRDKDFWLWAKEVFRGINTERVPPFAVPIKWKDFKKLKKTGEFSFEDDLGYTKAKTIYKIKK